ncbi:uncharacterized protein [Primulina huaijiensis]|uniref:uncharacterized protein isoform X1 n=1 Tax=Primulina huaijiensis TaxID=1492673 RepID=UPI003CC77DF9
MIPIISRPGAFNSPVISPIYISNPLSSIYPKIRVNFTRQSRRIQASSLVLPLLPFPIQQVLVPSEAKTIHLYEARYLALLEESLLKNDVFVHFVLDPIVFGGTSIEGSFAARYGCLVFIEKVEQLQIGALVSIRGVGRVKIVGFKQLQPYLTGEVIPFIDNFSSKTTEISSKVLELKDALSTLNSLEIKLKAPQEALLQTQSTNSLLWAEKNLNLSSTQNFIPLITERLSFVGFQPVSGNTQSEVRALQNAKLKAMDTKDTLERLDISMEFVKNNISMVAAKLAIQSLGVL